MGQQRQVCSRLRVSVAGVVACALTCALAVAPPLRAQSYPTQTITLVVAYPAGGVPDVIARIMGPALADRLGKPVVVENRGGASTTIGTGSVARSTPDGHTLLLGDVAMTVAPNIVAKLTFDHQRDLAPVAPLMRSYMTLLTHPSVPAATVGDLIALAKANPGTLKYGSSGIGTPPYLGALAFIQATGVEMLHVPYRGVALALNDVVGGHIQLVFVSQSVGASQVKAGNARALGVFGTERVASLPGVPTFRESGLDTRLADEGTWFGMMVAAGTPPAIIETLNRVVNEVLADPGPRGKLEAADFQPSGGTPEQLRAAIAAHTAHWREAFKRAGVKADQ